jgi:hypothetical protein
MSKIAVLTKILYLEADCSNIFYLKTGRFNCTLTFLTWLF